MKHRIEERMNINVRKCGRNYEHNEEESIAFFINTPNLMLVVSKKYSVAKK